MAEFKYLCRWRADDDIPHPVGTVVHWAFDHSENVPVAVVVNFATGKVERHRFYGGDAESRFLAVCPHGSLEENERIVCDC